MDRLQAVVMKMGIKNFADAVNRHELLGVPLSSKNMNGDGGPAPTSRCRRANCVGSTQPRPQ